MPGYAPIQTPNPICGVPSPPVICGMDVARVAQRRSSTKKAKAAAAAGATLPDDVVLEILWRVADAEDVAALFRCATACKRWRGLVSDPSFLRGRHRPDPSSSLLLGFFAQRRPYRPHTVSADPVPGARSPAFVPAPRSPLGPRRRSLASFLSYAAGSSLDLDDAEPLVSRHGLLLVRLLPRRGAPVDDVGAGRTLVHLAVCNLLVGTCDVLPPLKCRASSNINTCAILARADCCSDDGISESWSPLPSYSTFFKVLVIVFNPASTYYNLCTFSSAETSWITPRKCFSNSVHGFIDGGAVICRGMACWLVTDTRNFYTLDVCAKGGHVFLTDLPVPPDHHDYDDPLLSVAADGTLSLLLMDTPCRRLETWTLQGDGGEGSGSGDDDGAAAADWWLRTKVTELNPPKGRCAMMCLWVGERSGTLLFVDVVDDDQRLYVADLETGEMDEVTERFRSLRLGTAVPFEMDWLDFFLSRLFGGVTG